VLTATRTTDREAGMDAKTYQQKLAAAKEFLGTRWLLHPANRVERVTDRRVARQRGKASV